MKQSKSRSPLWMPFQGMLVAVVFGLSTACVEVMEDEKPIDNQGVEQQEDGSAEGDADAQDDTGQEAEVDEDGEESSQEDEPVEEEEETPEEPPWVSNPAIPNPNEAAPECEISDEEPLGILLTWQSDPTTTMTIDWHTEPGDEARPTLCIKEHGAEVWASELDVETIDYPGGEREIHRIEVTGLEADEEYSFQVGEFGREYSFRTMPTDIDEDPIRFATGGDTMHDDGFFARTNEVVLSYELDFIVWGGDLAYSDGETEGDGLERWYDWFETSRDTLIYEDGRVLPIMTAVGNHEVVDGYYFRHDEYEQTDAWREELAPNFYTFFAFPGHPGYATLDFGDYLSFFFLDTDHTNPVQGDQTAWLEAELSSRSEQGVPHLFPVYHVPAYPSHRSPEGDLSQKIRELWVPLFENYDVGIVLEAHDHTYKRTHPIREGQIDENGVTYLGDGAWGVRTREGDHKDEWYIAEFAADRHAIIITLQGDNRHVEVINEEGEIIDEMGEEL